MHCNAYITTHSFSTNDMLKPISAHFGYKSFGVFAGIMVCILPRYHNGTLLVCAALPNGRATRSLVFCFRPCFLVRRAMHLANSRLVLAIVGCTFSQRWTLGEL